MLIYAQVRFMQKVRLCTGMFMHKQNKHIKIIILRLEIILNIYLFTKLFLLA